MPAKQKPSKGSGGGGGSGKPHVTNALAANTNGASFNNAIAALRQNPYTYRFQAFGEHHAVTVTQQPEYGIAGVLWDCEQVLASYVTSEADRWNSRSCVELGAGTGLAAMACWRLGAFAVATDLPEVVADVTVPNVQAAINDAPAKSKRLKSTLAAAPLTWGNAEEGAACEALAVSALKAGLTAKPPKPAKAKKGAPAAAVEDAAFDYVIAADVVYHSDAHAPLFETVKQLVRGRCTFVFVHRRRLENDTNFLDKLLTELEVVRSTPVSKVEPAYPMDNLTIYEMRRKPPARSP